MPLLPDARPEPSLWKRIPFVLPVESNKGADDTGGFGKVELNLPSFLPEFQSRQVWKSGCFC